MQDEPLSLGRLLESATHRHAASTVSTWTGATTRTRTYAEVGARAGQVAGALVALGVGPSDRVATFMWNNNEHLEVYTAVPAMGAVLHGAAVVLAARRTDGLARPGGPGEAGRSSGRAVSPPR